MYRKSKKMQRNYSGVDSSVVSSIGDNFELDVPDMVIAMASGFPVGIGRSKCVCGAVSGGVMSLGLFFGRTRQGDPKVEKNLLLATANGKNSLCCRVLTKEFDMASGEHKEQCIAFTGLVHSPWEPVSGSLSAVGGGKKPGSCVRAGCNILCIVCIGTGWVNSAFAIAILSKLFCLYVSICH